MGGYFDRGAGAGGHDEGYFNEDNITGPEGAGSAVGGPGGLVRDDQGVEPDPINPNIVRAIPNEGDARIDETAGNTTQAASAGRNPAIIEGSDSERTGTSWGLPGVENAPVASTPGGATSEGEGPGDAHPNRNTHLAETRDELDDVGAWGTMKKTGSAGSPTSSS